jgi:hypothetical protein
MLLRPGRFNELFEMFLVCTLCWMISTRELVNDDCATKRTSYFAISATSSFACAFSVSQVLNALLNSANDCLCAGDLSKFAL